MTNCVTHVATTAGHSGFPPTTSTSFESKLIVGGMPVVVDGSSFAEHCKQNEGCHPSVAIASSSKVIVNGKALCLQGDSTSCGDTIASGNSKLVVS